MTAYTRTRPPAPATPWREAEFCVIDLETTGLDAAVDEIVSFAALQIAHGRLRLNDVTDCEAAISSMRPDCRRSSTYCSRP